MKESKILLKIQYFIVLGINHNACTRLTSAKNSTKFLYYKFFIPFTFINMYCVCERERKRDFKYKKTM